MLRRIFISASLIMLFAANVLSTVPLWGTLKPGPYKVGFKVIREKDQKGNLFLVSLWYPAEKQGSKMTLKDYVETGLWNGKEDKPSLSNGFKETVEHPFLFGVNKLSSDEYDKVLSTPVFAGSSTEIKRGKWPLIISDTEPVSLCVTNEWLASQGYIVAVPSADFPPPASDSLLYKAPTDALEYLLKYMVRQPFVDTSRISALGFGGGSMASFYLSMKTHAIKSMVNIEGGMFMPLSKTILSSDYRPIRFTIPLLHIVRPDIIKGESVAEFNAIASREKYRLTLLAATKHHDFTIYGRVVNAVLRQRGSDADLSTDVFTQTHELILEFIKHHQLPQSSIKSTGLFRLELFHGT